MLRYKDLKGASNALFFCLLFSSCTSPFPQWEYEETATCQPCYRSGRVSLPPKDPLGGLEVEFVRTPSVLRAYLNIYAIQVTSDPQHPGKAEVKLVIEDLSENVYADILQGGQRLLLPADATEKIVNALLQDKSIDLSVGRYHSTVDPHNFVGLYNKLCSRRE
jgi:hypothetical protein